MRRAAIVIFMVACSVVMAGEAPIVRSIDIIDLDAPGVLEKIRRERPEHFAKIQKILSDIPDQAPEGTPRWLRTEFDARVVDYGVFLTSDPPKARVSFMLGRSMYKTMVTFRKMGPKMLPTR